ncbi:MAG: hypothetical protein U0166_20030 [Acidobacteriota bacterium]
MRPRRIGATLLALAFPSIGMTQAAARHDERPEDPPAPARAITTTAPASTPLGIPVSVQVNVDAAGRNIAGDAANEPSLVVDPSDPSRMAIGWRQFDSVASNFRQAGHAYTTNGGQSWTNGGVFTPGNFRSDPVLSAGPDSTFYYDSLTGSSDFACDMFRSQDRGATWSGPTPAFGGDKAWMTVDRTGGPGRGNVYVAWSNQAGCCGDAVFIRSIDGSSTWSSPQVLPGNPIFGTLTVAPDGRLYVVGIDADLPSKFIVDRSSNAQDRGAAPVFEQSTTVNMGGAMASGGINPVGLLGQAWIAAAPSGAIYLLCSVASGGDPVDVMFSRSLDQGASWSAPLRVNDDAPGAWQWFGTMAVAPSGRIDVVWYDTRLDPSAATSVLTYSASSDGGASFSGNVSVSAPFQHGLGYPNQAKIGDYIHMISDDGGANLAYAATFNGEEDVWFVRISPNGGFNADVDRSGFVDGVDLILLGLSFGASSGDPRYNPNADIDGSGVVDGSDLTLLASAFGRAS